RPPAAAKAASIPRARPPASRNAVRPSRPARPPAPARQPEQPVDSDVALISAVIVYANGHAEAANEEARARE
ncbi:hypothetical protein, partial [Massilia sp. ST3]|uniref:hypothetical protein n=1 Tax=Massilia sp. ST3 TaxID=2824903 RepID=UPI001B8178DF